MSNSLNRCKLRHGWIKPFLNAIGNGFSEMNAANAAGVGTNAVRQLEDRDPGFKAEYEAVAAKARPRFGHSAW